jgi:hypothetical protein
MKENTGFKELLNKMMSRRWYITAMVLGGFMLIMGGIFGAIMGKTPMSTEWKELMLLLLGAFIGSYGKIIDYWFSDTDKDKMLVQKMDEEDGISLSSTSDIGGNSPQLENQVINEKSNLLTNDNQSQSTKVEIDEDGDGTMDGYDVDGDGKIDEYFDHRNCQHVWGDSDGDGDEECLICGAIKPIE